MKAFILILAVTFLVLLILSIIYTIWICFTPLIKRLRIVKLATGEYELQCKDCFFGFTYWSSDLAQRNFGEIYIKYSDSYNKIKTEKSIEPLLKRIERYEKYLEQNEKEKTVDSVIWKYKKEEKDFKYDHNLIMELICASRNGDEDKENEILEKLNVI
mgnify:CR=1 FL=1